jgi:hypothetical protein
VHEINALSINNHNPDDGDRDSSRNVGFYLHPIDAAVCPIRFDCIAFSFTRNRDRPSVRIFIGNNSKNLHRIWYSCGGLKSCRATSVSGQVGYKSKVYRLFQGRLIIKSCICSYTSFDSRIFI